MSTIKVAIKNNQSSDTIIIDVSLDETIFSAKEKYYKIIKSRDNNLWLYNDEELKDNKKISDYKIKNMDKIVTHPSGISSLSEIKIFIINIKGESTIIEVSLYDTIFSAKEKYFKAVGNKNYSVWKFEGMILRDNKKISDCDIEDMDIIIADSELMSG